MRKSKYLKLIDQYQNYATQKSLFHAIDDPAIFQEVKRKLLNRIESMIHETRVQIINDAIALNQTVSFACEDSERNTKKYRLAKLQSIQQTIVSEDVLDWVEATDAYCKVSIFNMPVAGVLWAFAISLIAITPFVIMGIFR